MKLKVIQRIADLRSRQGIAALARNSWGYFFAPRPPGVRPLIWRLYVWPRWIALLVFAVSWVALLVFGLLGPASIISVLVFATAAALFIGGLYALGQAFTERTMDEERIRRSYFPDKDDAPMKPGQRKGDDDKR